MEEGSYPPPRLTVIDLDLLKRVLQGTLKTQIRGYINYRRIRAMNARIATGRSKPGDRPRPVPEHCAYGMRNARRIKKRIDNLDQLKEIVDG